MFMQIAIPVPQRRRAAKPAARLCVTVAAISLLLLAAGTARAVVRAARDPGFDRAGPGLERIGTSIPLTMPAGAPGDTVVSTMTIALRGSDPAAVRLSAEVKGDLAPFLHVTILRGSGEGAAWIPDAGAPVFTGTLAALPASWASGVPDGTWRTGERHAYRIAVTLMDDQRAQGRAAEATFRWESRSV
jgi:hypothetical protein